MNPMVIWEPRCLDEQQGDNKMETIPDAFLEKEKE
uniref:Uncharacterized protein n=1 Tax=Arundo donax TaxID=35708 RepID=A0A0A8ZHA3_ARUDO